MTYMSFIYVTRWTHGIIVTSACIDLPVADVPVERAALFQGIMSHVAQASDSAMTSQAQDLLHR